ncbi:PRC-barrel domain containing protein [uncultured Paraglaciecola sp.]|uniref:PRC-barrel domain containing protein n=1 Tax=uncultured Paraglaciecola sp. TaxID=1765024 RepID=UPI0030D9E6C1|tara:strand:- start:14461 stop:15225 length:765 start_codon:yes stop_codon:yes gene_type:complete
MFTGLRDIQRFTIAATDGDIGVIKDFLFDDRAWTIRYMYVDTHKWLPLGEKVLISPISLREIDTDDEKIHVALSKQQIKDSPSIDEEKTVSREYEEILFSYLGYGYYWTGPGAWGEYANPTSLVNQHAFEQANTDLVEHNKSHANHLRSIDELQGYDVIAGGQTVGHIHDLILDTENWEIPFIIIDTDNWLPGGKKLLLAPKHIDDINWLEQRVHCTLPSTDIEHCPECDHDLLNDNDYKLKVKRVLQSLPKAK